MRYKAWYLDQFVTRTSERKYTHAVLWIKDGKITSHVNWCGSFDLAVKQAQRKHDPMWSPIIAAAQSSREVQESRFVPSEHAQ